MKAEVEPTGEKKIVQKEKGVKPGQPDRLQLKPTQTRVIGMGGKLIIADRVTKRNHI